MRISFDTSEVRRLLQRAPRGLERALRGTLEDGSALILRDLTEYPPELPDQEYRRTRTLGRSWSRTSVEGNGLALRVIVGSSEAMAPYNRVVQSEADQAEIHQGRWPTDEGVVRDRERDIQEMFEARVLEELGDV